MTREELEERIYDVLLNELVVKFNGGNPILVGKSEALKEIMSCIDEAVVFED